MTDSYLSSKKSMNLWHYVDYVQFAGETITKKEPG
jgi:hypothetical protein